VLVAQRRTSADPDTNGSPARCQASTPPIMSVERHSPMDRKLAAARLEL
jgi:hypothetical protein